MSPYKPAPVHLVGSFPTPDAATAFSRCATALKGRLQTIPDGEPGWRWNFTIGLVQKKAVENPAIGKIWREYDDNYDPLPVKEAPAEEVAQLREAIKATSWKLGYDEDAVESYKTFCKLRDEGVIDKDARFQVCLPGMSSFAIFVKPAYQYLVEDLAYQVLLQETEAIVAAIPAKDLALQFDIASDYIKNEAQRQGPSLYLSTLREDFHPPAEDAMERYAGQYAGLVAKVPSDAYTGLHICMGNINNKPVLAPRDMSVMVMLANRIISKAASSRPMQWVHFGCLPEWKDEMPYAPLAGLDKSVAVYLGVVYPNDLEGAKERVAAAKKQLQEFGVAPPCGLARTSEEGVQSVLDILKELSPQA